MVKSRTMRALILLHRWLGVPFCSAVCDVVSTGIVMHFVPFPALTEAERIDGLAPIDPSPGLRMTPPTPSTPAASRTQPACAAAPAQRRAGLSGVGPTPACRRFGADDLSRCRRKIRTSGADDRRSSSAAAQSWTSRKRRSPNSTITISGRCRTGLIVIVRCTASRSTMMQAPSSTSPRSPARSCSTPRAASGRGIMWAASRTGSTPRYCAASHGAWDVTVWSLSLVALIAAIAGCHARHHQDEDGVGAVVSPYPGWQKWHHVLGLGCMIFVLTWIFSGWLSMDHGRLFSTGKLSAAETASIAGTPAWESLPARWRRPISSHAREVEWFVFNGKFYRRDRTSLDAQRLVSLDPALTASSAPARISGSRGDQLRSSADGVRLRRSRHCRGRRQLCDPRVHAECAGLPVGMRQRVVSH